MNNSDPSKTMASKPYPSFPLTPHRNGQWCKKIRGRLRYFGPWAYAKAAFENYNRQAADLHAGRQPSTTRPDDIPSGKDLGNHYLAAQAAKANQNLITGSYFNYCKKSVKAFVKFVGKERRWDDRVRGTR